MTTVPPPGNATLQRGSDHEQQPARLEPGVPGLEPGAPRVDPDAPRYVPRGWHSRGYLPHFDGREATQHVTFHLADSLPKQVVERLDREIRQLPPEQQDAERRNRIEAWIDAGHGCCALRDHSIPEMVQNALLFFDGQRYRLLAWVVMPNHVHVLFQPLADWTIAQIVGSWKSFTGRRINAFPGNARLQPGSGQDLPPARLEPGAPGERQAEHRVWHRECWDRYIRDEGHFRQVVDYIHGNPVKAGLVARAEEWRWSSAGHTSQPARLEPGVPGRTP